MSGDVEYPGLPYDRLLETLGVGVVAMAPDGRVQAANQQARTILGRVGQDVEEQGLFATDLDVVDQEGSPLALADLPAMRTLHSGEPCSNVVLGVRSAGDSVVWILAGSEPVFDADGQTVTSVVSTFVDITAQRDAEDALRASEARFRLLTENAADVVYRVRVGRSPRFEYVNPAVQEVLGYAPEEFYENPGLVAETLHPDDRPRARELAYRGTDRVETVLLRMIRRDGPMIWTEHRVVPLRDARGKTVALDGIARDVTALKMKEADLSHRALHDSLTGLPNRVLLLDRLEAALARTRRHPSFLAVLFIDLDRFKTVNDNLGHDAGDRLLALIARRLLDTVRPSDSVARIGGDEFVAILPDLAGLHEAHQIAERLLVEVAEPVDLGEGKLVITASIGVAGAEDGAASASELLRRADFAMYSAKDRGRARVEGYNPQAADEPAPDAPAPDEPAPDDLPAGAG
jgi:diguanylate cyclase (GGDEF)-like protein/PAS domain S-box-containing protein